MQKIFFYRPTYPIFLDSYRKQTINFLGLTGGGRHTGNGTARFGYELGITTGQQGLSQVLETGCPKLAIVRFLGVQISKGDQNILIFQP